MTVRFWSIYRPGAFIQCVYHQFYHPIFIFVQKTNSHHDGEKEEEKDESRYNYEVALPEQQVREKIQADFRNAPFVWLQLTEEGQQMAEASTSEGTQSPGSPQIPSADSSLVSSQNQQHYMQQQNYQMYGQIPPPPPHPHPGHGQGQGHHGQQHQQQHQQQHGHHQQQQHQQQQMYQQQQQQQQV